MRADRLLTVMLLLQARGRMTALALATELEVSVRTVYRDLDALSTAGVPVFTETGPRGGCQLIEGYRAPLTGLSPEEASALLILGLPEPVQELGLGPALSAAHARVRGAMGSSSTAAPTRVHLDMPRWFHAREAVPHLPLLAEAVHGRLQVGMAYGQGPERIVHPLGLVNKSGVWYLVAVADSESVRVYRVGRISAARLLNEQFQRPPGFDLPVFWRAWSAEFEASLPRIPVVLRVSPEAFTILPELFGDAAGPAMAAAGPPECDGSRTLTLTFEHEKAAAFRLAGFGDTVEVVSPGSVRNQIVAIAHGTIRRYDLQHSSRGGSASANSPYRAGGHREPSVAAPS
ncbi:MAG: helix-turn-helix transcriptional regulator [Chloroflexota bacterium]